MFGGFGALLGRELRLALRHGSDTIMVLGFFVIAVALFPFGVGPAPDVLARIAVGILWVSALLAALLSLDRLFQQDYDDGSLDLLAACADPDRDRRACQVRGALADHRASLGHPRAGVGAADAPRSGEPMG